MNPWVAQVIVTTGTAVTFTDIADAPFAGAVVWVKMNAAHIWTDGAVFTVQGNASYTAANEDWIRIYATTVSTFEITIFKADGTAVVAPAAPASQPSVRQTVRLAATDSSGYSALLAAGAALNFNVDATPTNAVLDFAAGNTDYTATLTADASNQGSLVASNTNYITADYVSASSVTWGSYLIPPQYGYAFERQQNALLNFEGSDTSTTMLDDFGNTWTASGNAQIDTAQFKFGSSSLLCDGTGDYILSSNFTSMGSGSWEVSCWFRLNTTPGSGVSFSLFRGINASVYGVALDLLNTAGTIRTRLQLSSNGSSSDIADTQGSNTTWTTAQWNKYRIVFDALAGTYRVYLSLNGSAETQDITVSSTTRVCAITRMALGCDSNLTGNYNGWMDGFRFIRAATVTGTETPSASAFTIASQPVHYFSIPAMTMYEATTASASAGTNPTFTARNRLFVGEQDTGAGTVTATRNYALRGQYISDWFAVVASTSYSRSYNIGGSIPPGYEVYTADDAQGRYARPLFQRTTASSIGPSASAVSPNAVTLLTSTAVQFTLGDAAGTTGWYQIRAWRIF
tara:strand:- start:426 stop:2135 length:1710 start_codon:yes stop_codon:yes gene_type:complete